MYRYSCVLILLVSLTGCSDVATETTIATNDSTNTGDSTENATSDAPNAGVDESNSDTPATDQETPIIIDVRSQEEWDAGHLAKAVHIPHTEIADRISEVTGDKSAAIILYCAVGGRAGTAKTALEEAGFINVENGGGLEDLQGRFPDK